MGVSHPAQRLRGDLGMRVVALDIFFMRRRKEEIVFYIRQMREEAEKSRDEEA
mgnify:CR=1 FL=1